MQSRKAAYNGIMNNDRAALTILSLAMLLSSLEAGIAGIALPALSRAFGAPASEVQWVLVAPLLASTALVASAGRLGDLLGRRRLLLAGIALAALSSLASALAPSLPALAAARTAQGIGGAVMMALSAALAADIVPKERMGRAIGLLGGMSAAGTALAPALGGLLLSAFGWRAVFLTGAPLGLALFAAAAWALPSTLAQAEGAAPGIGFSLLHDPMLRAGLIANTLVMTVMMGMIVVGPFYLTQALGLAPGRVGLIMSTGPLVAAFAGIPAGRLTDRFGAAAGTGAGLLLTASGSLLLSLLPPRLGVPGFVVPFVLMTGGYALFQAANGAALLASAGPAQRGSASGLLTLSRNLGRAAGAYLMGAVFAGAATSGAIPSAAEAAAGSRAAFTLAAVLITLSALIALRGPGRRVLAVGAALFLALCSPSFVFAAAAPTPAGPYPLEAAGWGPQAGHGHFVSRWAEDWTTPRALGKASPLKAMPLFGEASLTLSGELRVRYEDRRDSGSASDQWLTREAIGADLRFSPAVRAYAELARGGVGSRRDATTARFQNDASLQQAFGEIRGWAGSTLIGIMAGRQEFADAPRQLVSLGDGPNIHRTWNGARLYIHAQGARFGAFEFAAIRPERGAFDERIAGRERLGGVNASIALPGLGDDAYLDPFSLHSDMPAFRAGGRTGRDERRTFGARLWGRRDAWTFDWTAAGQTGDFNGRRVAAWAVFAHQSMRLSGRGWKPRLTARLDAASGGGAYGSGAVRAFNPLYPASGYLGEGRFLSTSNLLLLTPGLAFTPDANTVLTVEYGLANRLSRHDAVYGGGMRAYPGTESVEGREIGGQLRISSAWRPTPWLSVAGGFERLSAGTVLARAAIASGSFSFASVTLRY